MLLAGAKGRARRSRLPFDLREEDIVIPVRCPVLGLRIRHNWNGKAPTDNSPTLDRLVPSRGYTRGNVIVVSMRANRLRSDGLPFEHRMIAVFYQKRLHAPQRKV